MAEGYPGSLAEMPGRMGSPTTPHRPLALRNMGLAWWQALHRLHKEVPGLMMISCSQKSMW